MAKVQDTTRASGRSSTWWALAWWSAVVATVAVFVAAIRQAVPTDFYRIDVDVYRQGAQAWVDGHQLYGDAEFLTQFPDYYLPFTYPPISAVLFAPMTWVSLQTATTIVSMMSVVLLVVSTTIVLTGLDVWPTAPRGFGPAWLRRGCLATAVVAVVLLLDLEPISNNFACGQINVMLMTLVLADCVLRRTAWPRGVLLGIAISIKLTPAVFLLYFVLRKDWRAAATAMATFVVSIALAFALAPRDSWEYWTGTLIHTDRIGDVATTTNQNLAGMLARFGLTGSTQTAMWLAACLLTLALTVWATRRVLRAGEPALALICVALMGLLVSPVSWSHHWVWALPTFVVVVVVCVRRRDDLPTVGALIGITLIGLALMHWSLVRDEDAGPGLAAQTASSVYVWWGLAFITAAGLTVSRRQSPGSEQAAQESPATQPTRP